MLTSLKVAGVLNTNSVEHLAANKLGCDEDFDDLKPATDSFSRASTTDTQLSDGDREYVERQLCSTIANMDLAVSLADPLDSTHSLKMVSEGFEEMTGFSKAVACGKSCRFMTHECHNNPEDLAVLRTASRTGAPATVILENRKATGEAFLHLLHVQGICVGWDNMESEEIWHLIGIHIDVSDDEADVDTQELIEKAKAEIKKKFSEILRPVAEVHSDKFAVEVFHEPVWMTRGCDSNRTDDSDFDEEEEE